MALDQRMKGLQNRRTGTDLVGQRRKAQINALSSIALALAVQRLVLAKLLEQDHGQQLRPGKATRRHVERCRRLGDRLAIPARELLSHRLDCYSACKIGSDAISMMSTAAQVAPINLA
jgi:hypothetical protein